MEPRPGEAEAVALTVNPVKSIVRMNDRGVQFTDLDSMVRFGRYIEASGLAPKGVDKLEAIVVAMQLGAELGLPPLAAIQNIAVVNGRPTLWGDAQLAVVRSTGELEAFAEWYEVGATRLPRNPSEFPDNLAAVCEVKRKGYPAASFAFSVSDAKRAGLWGKSGPWSQYPARMLRYRSRAFVLRDQFGDALRGLKSTEEAYDSPAIEIESSSRPATGTVTQVTTNDPEARTEAPPEPNDGDPTPTVQEELAELVNSLGSNFDRFKAFGLAMNRLDERVTCFDDLSDASAAFFLKNHKGLANAIKAKGAA